MPHLDDTTLRVLKVLDQHRSLDVLQIASLAEMSVSAATSALEQLTAYNLLTTQDGDDAQDSEVYSLNKTALSKMLEVA